MTRDTTMLTVQYNDLSRESPASTEQLLTAVARMPTTELNTFVAQILKLRAQREAPQLSSDESALLLRINQPISTDRQQRYDALIAKRQTETLSPEEHTELVNLTDHIEEQEADRADALAELARLRDTTITEVMDNLGITPPRCV
jgi:hypothetical protein